DCAKPCSGEKYIGPQVRPLFLLDAEHPTDAFGGFRHDRIDQCSNHTQRVRRVIEGGLQQRAILRLLCKPPRLALDDVLVDTANEDIPDRLKGNAQLEPGETAARSVDGPLNICLERTVEVVARMGGWYGSVTVPRNHRRGAADDIAEIVGEVRVIARQNRFV